MKSSAAKIALAALALAAVAAGVVAAALAASLPDRSGTTAVRGLGAAVEVEFDARAVPRIRAASFEDALRAQGFVHAQERYFQMDLARRSTAGELAEIVGEAALPLDTAQRPYDFRRRAGHLLDALPARHRAWLRVYVAGVNAGLEALSSRPPEYWALGMRPAPWTIEDSLLVVLSFYTMLSNNEAYEKYQGVMRAALAPEVYDFLTPSTTRFDRPLLGPRGDPSPDYTPRPIPPAHVLDVSREPARRLAPGRVDPPLSGASNQWAADGTRSAHGDAILANDPHLRLRLPNVFYRAELYWPEHTARGVSIPGLPGILLGSSERLAWGATVSNADQSDWVVVETDAEDPQRYRVPGGSEAFEHTKHEIAVAGRAEPAILDVRSTRWGPVLERDWRGRPLALRATWLEPGGANLEVLDLMFADSAEAGVRVLERWAGPSLNWMLADAHAAIAWIANGPLPRRDGFDGSVPESWADGGVGWRGEQRPPRAVGAERGVLFTANNRTLPREEAARLSRMWMRPFRAHRIDALLGAAERFDERTFLDMQLDTRAAAYDRLRDLVLEVTAPDEPESLLRAARSAVERWNGRADVAQTGFRILHVYYLALLERALVPLLTPALEADAGFVYRWPLADEPLRRLLDERPAHLLTSEHEDWPAFLRATLLDAVIALEGSPARLSAAAPWGEVNRLDVAHPLAQLPLIGRWLRLPPRPQPGSMVSLRVAAPDYGAVFRMAVAPARPEEGILQMAGGQSGHFLSANFDDLHEAWAAGKPTPFLAGPTQSTLTLAPAP